MNYFKVENNSNITNLVYELEKDDSINSVGLGMLENNTINGILPMVYSQVNNECLFKYNITSKVPMSFLFDREINQNTVVNCFLNIVKTIMSAQDYMLEVNSFIIDMEYIYINVSTFEAELLYLPLVNSKEVNMEMFFKNIIFSAKFDQSENCNYVIKIISYLNSDTFSLQSFADLLDEIKGTRVVVDKVVEEKKDVKEPEPVAVPEQIPQPRTTVDASLFNNNPVADEITPHKKVKKEKNKKKGGLFGRKSTTYQSEPQMAIPGVPQPVIASNTVAAQPVLQSQITQTSCNFGETTVLNAVSDNQGETTVLSQTTAQPVVRAYIVRLKNQEKKYIDKDIFRIGKENSFVDYFIGNNTAISRSHANIVKREDQYYIIDVNSKNHTYINGRIIQSNIEEKLESGMILRLADEEFKFTIGY